MTEHKSSLTLRMLLVSSGILVSRVLGLLRDVVFAYVFGTGKGLAAFVIANTFPNLLRHLFGEGAFSNAMVPVFSNSLEREGCERAWKGACRVISVLIVAVSALVVVGIIGVLMLRPWLTGELGRLTLDLTPWLLPYAVLVCVSAALAAVLNSVGRFGIAAYSQTIMNFALITAALIAGLSAREDGDASRVWFLVAGVLAAGILQVVFHIRAARNSFGAFRFSFGWSDPMVRRVSGLMLPGLLGAGVMQVNVVADRLLAGWLGEVETTSLYFSQRLIYLPVGLFGVAMGMVALPMMSRSWARRERELMEGSLEAAFRQVLFLTLPAAALMGALRLEVIQLLFERGGFVAESTRATAWALLFYLPGIPAFACAKIAVTPFYARQDTMTPVKAAVFCMVLNILLNLLLMRFLAQGGLALATTISSSLNVLILLILTARELGGGILLRILKGLIKILPAAALAFLAAAGVAAWLEEIFGEGWLSLMTRIAAALAAGGVIYLLVCSALGCREPREMIGGLRRRNG